MVQAPTGMSDTNPNATNAFSYLLFLRFVPVFPFWLVNLAPGLLGVPFRTYVLATMLGIVPGTFAFALAGNGLDSVIEGQRAAHQSCLANAGEAGQELCPYGLDPGALLTTELIAAFSRNPSANRCSLGPALAKRTSRSVLFATRKSTVAPTVADRSPGARP